MRRFRVLPVIGYIVISTSFMAFTAYAQEGIGLNPSSMKWRQIQTATGKIIYPEGLDSAVARSAQLIGFAKMHDSSVLGERRMQDIPVIIQNQNIYPAGFATPAPWRMELHYTSPQNQFLGPTPWVNALTLHEYRHAQQFSAANRGFTRIPEILMGETGWLIYTLATQPLWFREGDAVLAETAGTMAGRGRLPSFNADYRALRLEGYDWPYDKGTWISFKDYVPNPYRIGYYMVTYARRHFGEKVWEKVLKDAYTEKAPFYPFTRSLKKHTGLNSRQLYRQTLNELDSIFAATNASLTVTPSQRLTSPVDAFTSYRYPHYLSDSMLIAEKSGYKDISSIYAIGPGGNEKKLCNYGIYTTDHRSVSAAGNTICWAVADYHERWTNKNYSNIVTYDLNKDRYNKITTNKKYFSPASSYDGKKIVAVEMNTQLQYALVILDAESGELLKTIPTGNMLYTQPRWTHDGRHVVAIAITQEGNALHIVEVESGRTETLIDFTSKILERPFEKDGYVYFSAGFGSISNIFAIGIEGGEIYQLTSTRFGAYDPAVSPGGTKLAYSEYTAKGYKISEIAIDRNDWRTIDLPVPADIHFHETATEEGESPQVANGSTEDMFSSRPYRPGLQGLFNVYGWIPLPNVPEYGLELYTRNIMSTTIGTYGVAYHTKENALRTYARFTYAFLYPVLELQASMGERRSRLLAYRDSGSLMTEQADWREHGYSAGLRIPLLQTQKAYSVRANVGGSFKHYDIYRLDIKEYPSSFGFNALEGQLEFSRVLETARRHIRPRWGQSLALEFQKGVSNMANQPERLFADARMYFPGLLKTHSFNVQGVWQGQKVINTYPFQSSYLPARGYNISVGERIYRASFNYEFPIVYPDLVLGPVAFVQRIRSNIFYDHSAAALQYKITPLSTFSSTGAELLFDLRLFRLFQMSVGLQYSYRINEPVIGNRHYFTVIVPSFELLN